MKRFITISILLLCYNTVGKTVRIIQLGDVATWYINSDLVIAGKIVSMNTISYNTDTIESTEDYFSIYTNGREKYGFEIDTIIKGKYLKDTLSIYTPTVLYFSKRQSKIQCATINMDNYSDDSWYRL